MKKIAIYLTIISTLISTPVLAGLFDDDEARRAILDIRQQILDSKNEQEKRYNQLQTAIISLQNQIEMLQTQKNDNYGKFEVINNDLAKLKSSYELLANSYTDKLNAQEQAIGKIKQNLNINSENYIGSNPNGNLENYNNSDNGGNSNQNRQNFNKALHYFSQGDFKNSAQEFNLLLSSNSDVSLMPLIVYYLGNSYYALQKYKLASAQLLSFINNYPSHDKIPDVYLTLASIYAETNDKASTKKTLEYIIRNYPKNNAANLAQKRLLELKK